jgi:hypothetical protein
MMDRACDDCGEQMRDLYEYKGEMLCFCCFELAQELDDDFPEDD